MIVCDTAMKPVTSSLTGDKYKGADMIEYLKKNVKSLLLLREKLLKECGKRRH